MEGHGSDTERPAGPDWIASTSVKGANATDRNPPISTPHIC